MTLIIYLLFIIFTIFPDSSSAFEISEHTTLTEDSVEIFYETQGEGVPIFIIAGGPGGNPNFYRHTHKDWLDHGMLVYVHNRGRGHSQILDSVEDAYSVQNDVKDIEAVRNDLGTENIIIYGHSYGGTAALLYAATYPDNCLALITSCTHSGQKSFQKHNIDAVKYFLQRQFPKRWQTLDSLHQKGLLTSDTIFENVWPDLDEMYYYDPQNAEIMDSIWGISRDSLAVGFNYMVYLGIVGPDPEWEVSGTLSGLEVTPLLNRVHCPALILSGRYDRICPPVVQMEIAEALPDGELVIFEKSGHRPFIEEPAKFFEVTGQFLLEVTDKKGGE
jgi:proline iminopeptidase